MSSKANFSGEKAVFTACVITAEMVAVIASTSTDTVPGDELEGFEAITLACSVGGWRCSLSCWSFSRRHFLEKRLLKLAKINKTETIDSTAGDRNTPREPLLSGKLLTTWPRLLERWLI